MYFPMLIITTMSVKKNQIKENKGIHAKSEQPICV